VRMECTSETAMWGWGGVRGVRDCWGRRRMPTLFFRWSFWVIPKWERPLSSRAWWLGQVAQGADVGRERGEGGGEKVARMSQRLAYASVAVCAGTSPPQQWAARSSLQTARAMNGGAQTARPLADPHTVKLRLWDFTLDNTPSGAEDSQLHTLLRHADAVCLVYDITRHTFSKVLSL
jgi:hypothetical protein